MRTRPMTAVAWVLVLVFGATSVWLWRALEEVQERERQSLPEASQGANEADATVIQSPAGGTVNSAPRHAANRPVPEDTVIAEAGEYGDARNPRPVPDMAEAETRRAYFRASYANQYPDLAQVLDIPESTANRLLDILAERQMQLSVFHSAARKPGGDNQFALTLRQESDLERFEADAQIAALIGEAKMRQWKSYQSSFSERDLVKRLRVELMDSPDRVDREKGEVLVRALHEERERIESEFYPSGVDPGEFTEERHREFQVESYRRMLKAAEKVLSARQFKAFRGMLERERTFDDLTSQIDSVQILKGENPQ